MNYGLKENVAWSKQEIYDTLFKACHAASSIWWSMVYNWEKHFRQEVQMQFVQHWNTGGIIVQWHFKYSLEKNWHESMTEVLTSSLIVPRKLSMKLFRVISCIYTPPCKNCNKQNTINGYAWWYSYIHTNHTGTEHLATKYFQILSHNLQLFIPHLEHGINKKNYVFMFQKHV